MDNFEMKYVCNKCGKQLLKINETNLLKLAVSMMFSSYLDHGTFVLEGICEECACSQQIIFCAAVVRA
ncbi:MAG: hypothetical protein DRO67_10535 [Candidatus Asgardarchaeum californiense]|nr:MAG: hypothetical protein DRO67_10535 [Candidatus Asgardarchaeum californiense]